MRVLLLTAAHHARMHVKYVPVLRMCACTKLLWSALQFLVTLYSFWPFWNAVKLIQCHEWLHCYFDDAEFLSPCADEISVITDAPWWMRLGAYVWLKSINVSSTENVVVRESNSGTVRSDPLEKKGTGISTFWEMCRKNIQLCTNEASMPHARFYVTLKKDDESVGVDNCSALRGGNDKGRRQFCKGTYSE